MDFTQGFAFGIIATLAFEAAIFVVWFVRSPPGDGEWLVDMEGPGHRRFPNEYAAREAVMQFIVRSPGKEYAVLSSGKTITVRQHVEGEQPVRRAAVAV